MEVKSGGITSSLIVKFSGEKDLKKITRLDFYSKSFKIKRIENLEECENLQELRLSYNYISKIENLQTLFQLKILDLSENSIKKIENLSSLIQLEQLNLSGNLLKEIDRDELAGLVNLTVLNISKNKIARFSEFGNLEVLISLENVILSGNQVKSADLKEFLPSKVKSLKLIDNESVIHNPSLNASLWVIKDNLKDLKSSLIEKSKTLNKLIGELNSVQGELQDIEKSTPDKKYMQELLDRAEVLNTTSLNLQQSMTKSRDSLNKYNSRLEHIRKNEKETGNLIVEEIQLIDEAKKIRENIEEQEIQYGVVIEELEKIALEITKIDSVINSTPKFKSSEARNLETKATDLAGKIREAHEEINAIKSKIDECNGIIGFSGKEIDRALEKVWYKLTDQVWVEESEDLESEYKKWAEKVCEIIDKDRTEFIKISTRQNDEIKRLEAQIQFLNGQMTEGKTDQKNCGFQIEDLTEEIEKLRKTIERKNKEIADLQEKTAKIELGSVNEEGNKDFMVDVYRFAGKMGFGKDWKKIFAEIENYKNLLKDYEEKCQRFKGKKKKLVESFQVKNQEISEKIQKINLEKQEILKEKQEIQREKQTINEIKGDLEGLKSEIQENELKFTYLAGEKNSLETAIIKLEYRLKNLQEECEIYNEKKFKLLEELKRMQSICDSEGELAKIQEARFKIKDSSTVKRQEALQGADWSGELSSIEYFKLSEEYKNKESTISHLDRKIKECQVQLKLDLESQIKFTKQRQVEILKLDEEITGKKETLHNLNFKIEEIQKKTKNFEDKFEESKAKLINNEEKTSDIDKINKQLIESIKMKESKIQVIDKEIQDRQVKLSHFELVIENLSNSIRQKEEDLDRISLKRDKVKFSDTERPFGGIIQAEVSKSKILQEISEISTNFSLKEAEHAEKLKKIEIKIEYSEKTLEHLRSNIESSAVTLTKNEQRVKYLANEIEALEVSKDKLQVLCESLKAELRSLNTKLKTLKSQEKESLVLLTMSGYDINSEYKERIKEFVSSL